jgi:ketosteroid isomerase-like protein
MTRGLLLALICAPSLLVSAQNDANSGVQSKIIALEKAWNQAYKLGDTRALEGILDDRIVLINDDGSIQTKAEFLASLQPAKSQEQQVAPESMNVRVFGNTAIATGVFRADSKLESPTCGGSALWIPGLIKVANGYALPRMQPPSSTER